MLVSTSRNIAMVDQQMRVDSFGVAGAPSSFNDG
jgi:hypothetical protein